MLIISLLLFGLNFLIWILFIRDIVKNHGNSYSSATIFLNCISDWNELSRLNEESGTNKYLSLLKLMKFIFLAAMILMLLQIVIWLV